MTDTPKIISHLSVYSIQKFPEQGIGCRYYYEVNPLTKQYELAKITYLTTNNE